MRRRPEEVDPAQEAEEERRVTERRQRAADIRNQENEKDHDMDVVAPVVVRPQQGPDHDHRGAGGADDASHHRADGEDDRVGARRAVQIAGDQDAARDREEREEQDDEGQIFEQRRMEQGASGRRRSRAKPRAARAAAAPRRLRTCRSDAPTGGGTGSARARSRAAVPAKGSAQPRPMVAPPISPAASAAPGISTRAAEAAATSLFVKPAMAPASGLGRRADRRRRVEIEAARQIARPAETGDLDRLEPACRSPSDRAEPRKPCNASPCSGRGRRGRP